MQPIQAPEPNQHCAFSVIRYFWTDSGTYCVDNSPTSTLLEVDRAGW